MKDDKIVITKTPLRVSFVGGGTDMPYFYNKYGGTTISCAINRYIYVTAKFHNNYQEKYRLNYSETENTNNLNKIKNLRIKKVIKMLNINKPLYINTFADIPANSGLGSSSSFTVGLINALGRLQNKGFSKNKLAEMAFKIEAEITNNSLGKQDHYIAAYGGMKLIKYSKKKIIVSNINLTKKKLKLLFESLMLVWTGKSRLASDVLKDQKKNLLKNFQNLKLLNKISIKFKKELKNENIELKKLGELISETWNLKKNFSKHISNYETEILFNQIKKKGVYGGKLLGAGNGGFILAILNKKRKKQFSYNLRKYKLLNIELEKNGSKVL